MYILISEYTSSFAGAEPDEIVREKSVSYHDSIEARKEAKRILSLNNKDDFDEYYSIIGIFDTDKNLYEP